MLAGGVSILEPIASMDGSGQYFGPSPMYGREAFGSGVTLPNYTAQPPACLYGSKSPPIPQYR